MVPAPADPQPQTLDHRRIPLRTLLPLVALGGAVGALLRFGLGELLPEQGMKFPWTTLLVNISGSAALGLLVGVAAVRTKTPAWVVPTLGTGLLGAYTTFSTIIIVLLPSVPGAALDSLTTVTYVSPGILEAGAYLMISLIFGTMAAAAGLVCARGIFGYLGQDAERRAAGRGGTGGPS
ncbi:MAG: CrcB family protein [Nesterenkonia sp.]|nr:CrcB family protein [Nesterenkonia sp.]